MNIKSINIKNNKMKIKWLYDLMMVVLFVLMFNKRVISMSFHEIGGLILIVAVIGHICINYRYVINVSKRLFSKQIPINTRIGYLVNVCLLAAFALIVVSGVFMSKVVFNIQGGNGWKTVHYSSSAASLILIGVHIGLHWGFIKGIFKKFVRIPQRVARPVAYVLMVAVLLFGSISLVTSSFGRWIVMPFTTQQNEMSGNRGNKSFANGKEFAKNENNRGQKSEDFKNFSKGKGQGNGTGKEMRGQQGKNVTVISVIATFLSIVGVFAILTYWIEQFFIHLKRKKKVMALPDNSANQ